MTHIISTLFPLVYDVVMLRLLTQSVRPTNIILRRKREWAGFRAHTDFRIGIIVDDFRRTIYDVTEETDMRINNLRHLFGS